MLQVHPIPAFQDNYIWAIHAPSGACAVVDPGDARVVEAYLADQNLTLCAILITHHHPDHTAGLGALCANRDIPVYGPAQTPARGITHGLQDGDHVHLDALDLALDVLEVPGHTLDHIAFFGHGKLFCGDTLFSGGCGRLFEGTPAQMLNSLRKLQRLPADTQVYCTHEYTLANFRFAQSVDPDNPDLAKRTAWAKTRREQDQPTLPSDLGTETAINPFLRCDQPAVIAAAQSQGNCASDEPEAVFAAIRTMKDNY